MADRIHGAWWREDKDDAHGEVFKRLAYLEDQNADMRRDNRMFLELLSGWNIDGSGSSAPIMWNPGKGMRPRRNLCLAIADVAASYIAANRTIPSITTNNGDFSIQLKAKAKAEILHTQMWATKAFKFGSLAAKDGFATGSGFTLGRLSPDTGLPEWVRPLPNSLLADAAEGSNPRTLFWVSFVPRESMLGYYEKAKDALRDSAGPSAEDWDEYLQRHETEADMVKVVCAWHLPVRGKGGRYVVCVNNATLVDLPYTRNRFPLAKYNYTDRLGDSWFGQGLVERTLPAQLELADIEYTTRQIRRNLSNTNLWIEENSNVQPGELTNYPGGVYTYAQTMPTLMVNNATPPDLLQAAQQIWQETFEQEGFSVNVAGGELVQKGLGSARAIRAGDDVVTRRHVIPTRQLEDYYLQMAQVLSDLNDDAAAIDSNYEIKGAGAKRTTFLATSRWAELAIEEGDASIQVMPMSATPTTIQGKLASLEEYVAGGFMDQQDALALMEFPDLSSKTAMLTASPDLIKWQISRILHGIEELPIERQDLALTLRISNDAYLVAYRMGASEEVLELFDKYTAYTLKLQADQAKKLAEQNSANAPAEGDPAAEPVPTDLPPNGVALA